jgi:hypothetical protein
MSDQNLPAVTPQQALTMLKEQDTPEAKALLQYINGIEKKNVAVIGEDECFTLRDSNGVIKAFKSKMTFSVQNGGLVNIQGSLAITSQGYEAWARKTGASVIKPKKVEHCNEYFPNPHPVRDERGMIIGIVARAVAFAYSEMGIPIVSDWTTIYSPPAYRMVDLFAKAKKFKQCFRLLPVGKDPEEKETETWAPYPFDESVTFWVNTTHDEVFDWYSQMTRRDQKAMDTAQTFVRRNALKHLSALQKAPHDNWTIAVMAWRPMGDNLIKWDGAQYSDLQDRIENMIDGESPDLRNKEIEYHRGEGDAIEEEGFETLEAEVDPEESAEDQETVPEQQQEPKRQAAKDQKQDQKEPSKSVKQVLFLAEKYPSEFGKACSEFKIDPGKIETISDEIAVQIYDKISDLIDAQN